MKHLYLFLLLIIGGYSAQATVHDISVNGFTYTPDTITINVGDTISWSVTSSHPAREVDEPTYTSNGSTSNGGFSTVDGDTTAMTTSGTFYYVCINHFSSGMKGMIVVEPTTGIEKNTRGEEISIYPNPAESFITIKNAEASDVEVLDMLGHRIQSLNINATNNTIDVNSWRSGVYFIRIKVEEGLVTRKVVVQ